MKRMQGIIYQVGDTFGCQTIISAVPRRKGKQSQHYWECRCSCGAESLLCGQFLRKTPKYCLFCATGNHHMARKTVTGKRAILTSLEKNINMQWAQYRLGAKNRGFGFHLSYDDFVALLKGSCIYCGKPPQPLNGIDRVDNRLGYTSDNSRSCCTICNRAKRERSKKDYEQWLDSASRHRFLMTPVTIQTVRAWAAHA